MAQQQRSQRKHTQLSDFQGLTQIGHGAFGKVYKAIHKSTKKQFALKKISKKQVKAQNMITQLNNQIKISRQLDHPNIIRLYDTFDDGEDIYLVLQLAPNGQLFSKICREGKLDQRTTKQIIRQLLQAVSYLHSRDPPIIHRDIKPENILLDKNNHVKLADFGWSNFLNKPRKTYCGTFDYLAPEMIDKSGHDEKLDIWCLGVLAYELLTGRTPFVVQGPKNEIKKIIEQNILQVNINFPNDFPIPAKNFILGMIKRNPKQRMLIKDMMNHQWLTSINNEQKPLQLNVMSKKTQKEVPLIDAQNSNSIIDSLNKKIKYLQNEVNRLKISQKTMTQQLNKGISDNPQYSTLMKELRKLKGIEQKSVQLQIDNEKYWEQLGKKDKQIIQLKGQLKILQDNRQDFEKLKNDKKLLQQKIKKYEKDIENFEIKNAQLTAELSGLSDSVGAKILRGQKLKLNEAQSQQFIQHILSEMKQLSQKFEETKSVLLKVLSKEKISKEKQEELVRLRVQQKRLKQQLKAELKQEFQQKKDKILIQARAQLSEERCKWMEQRAEFQRMYQQRTNQTSGKDSYMRQDLQLQIKTCRQLQAYHQSTINEQRLRIKQLQQQCKRKK